MTDERQYCAGWYESSEATTQDYTPSGTWEFLRFPGSIELANGSAGEALAHERDDRSLVVFTLHIRRKSLYYTVNLCAHCSLLASYFHFLDDIHYSYNNQQTLVYYTLQCCVQTNSAYSTRRSQRLRVLSTYWYIATFKL